MFDIDKKVQHLKKGDNRELEGRLNSKFEELKLHMTSKEDFDSLKKRVMHCEKTSSMTHKIAKRVEEEQESIGGRVAGHDGMISNLKAMKADKAELQEIVEKLHLVDDEFDEMMKW
jgi:hypothetical protein